MLYVVPSFLLHEASAAHATARIANRPQLDTRRMMAERTRRMARPYDVVSVLFRASPSGGGRSKLHVMRPPVVMRVVADPAPADATQDGAQAAQDAEADVAASTVASAPVDAQASDVGAATDVPTDAGSDAPACVATGSACDPLLHDCCAGACTQAYPMPEYRCVQ
jgi:hypothetical protein